MYISVENDSGAYVTMFNAWKGYNIRLVLGPHKNMGHETLECQIVEAGGARLDVRLFVGDEDEPKGEIQTIEFEDIEEVVIY